MPVLEAVANMTDEMTEWRHYLHRHPETAFEERITSAYVAGLLESFGLEVSVGIGKTGVVATLRRGDTNAGPVALRADFDALDIEEENGCAYRSEHPGKMHACGHDGHTAMLLGAAKLLARDGGFSGTVHFIFQPAEENEGGGRAMIEDGLFERFPCGSVYALHNFPVLPVGCFAIRKGPMAAAFDIFDIEVRGAGGHAAMPHIAKDPVVAAAHLVCALQTIASRNLNPVEAAVVSVTEIRGGAAYNVIPASVAMRGTTRHFLPAVQDMVEARLKEIASGTGAAMGVDVEVKYERRYPALSNSDRETDNAIEAASRVVPREGVITALPPLMGSEDFAFMLARTPGAYIGIGAGAPGKNGMLHQAGYDFNDALLPIGASYWVELVRMLLPE